eukprot:4013117-Amphidinium_carterae.1
MGQANNPKGSSLKTVGRTTCHCDLIHLDITEHKLGMLDRPIKLITARSAWCRTRMTSLKSLATISLLPVSVKMSRVVGLIYSLASNCSHFDLTIASSEHMHFDEHISALSNLVILHIMSGNFQRMDATLTRIGKYYNKFLELQLHVVL